MIATNITPYSQDPIIRTGRLKYSEGRILGSNAYRYIYYILYTEWPTVSYRFIINYTLDMKMEKHGGPPVYDILPLYIQISVNTVLQI